MIDPTYWVVTYALTASAHKDRDWLSIATVWTTTGLVLAGLLQSLPGFIQFVSRGLVLVNRNDVQKPNQFARIHRSVFCVMCLVIVLSKRVAVIEES